MGKLVHITIALIMVAALAACANSEDKWSKDDSMDNSSKMTSENNWKKDGESTDASKKSTSSYWKDSSNY